MQLQEDTIYTEENGNDPAWHRRARAAYEERANTIEQNFQDGLGKLYEPF